MGRLRQLSGSEVLRILESFGFHKHSQRGYLDSAELRKHFFDD